MNEGRKEGMGFIFVNFGMFGFMFVNLVMYWVLICFGVYEEYIHTEEEEYIQKKKKNTYSDESRPDRRREGSMALSSLARKLLLSQKPGTLLPAFSPSMLL